MKVTIQTRGGSSADGERRVESKVIWRGELSAVPRVGDLVCVVDGWAADYVHEVFYEVYEDSVVVVLNVVDEMNEYPEVRL
jgi:hypothetical protein